MKVKNIMFSGFAAAILMGVGAADAVVANPVTLADQGYVDAKVGQAEAAAKKHFDDKYDSTETLTTLLSAKEDAANKVASVDLEDAEGKLDLAKLSALDSQTDKYPSVSAAKSIAEAVLASVDEVSSQVGTLGTDVAGLKVTVGDANSGLVKAVADNTSAIETLNGDAETTGSVAKIAADAAADAVDALGIADYAKTAEVANTYATKAEITQAGYATKTEAEGYATTAVNALGIADYAKTADVANTYATKAEITEAGYATKAEITEANYATKTEAEGYATTAVNALGIADYAKTADVNAELDNKLDKTAIDESAGTYMVTSDGAGNITYTKVRVATVDDEGNATVTE